MTAGALLAITERMVQATCLHTTIAAALQDLTLDPLLSTIGNPWVDHAIYVINRHAAARRDQHFPVAGGASAHSAIVLLYANTTAEHHPVRWTWLGHLSKN